MLVPPTLSLVWEACVIYALKLLLFNFGNFQLEFICFPTQQAGEHLGQDTPVDEPGTGI